MVFQSQAMQAPLAKSLLEVDGVREVPANVAKKLDMGQNMWENGKIWVWIDPILDDSGQIGNGMDLVMEKRNRNPVERILFTFWFLYK